MRFVRPRLRSVVQLCLAQFAVLTGMVCGGSAEEPLQLTLYTPMSVDGSATTASTTLQLYNPNRARVGFSLSIRSAIAKNTGLDADWVVVFYGHDNKPGSQTRDGSIPALKSLSVRMDLSHVIEAGETDADLMSFGQKIDTLKLVKDRGLPFKVSLEGNPTEKPEIEFTKGRPLDLNLKNDDAMYYPVEWEMFIKGRSVSGPAKLGPNGSTSFTVNPDDEWFSLYQSFFKSEQVDGTLRVGYKPQGASGAYPSKTIPIRARLNDHDPLSRDFWGTVAILVILALGGLASVYVNVDLVNRLKKIFIRERLGQLARIIGEIQPQLSSQLRVSLWLERVRIVSTLPTGALFTPNTAAVLTQSGADTDALTARVDLASQIADASVRLNRAIDSGAIQATLFDQGAWKLEAAQDLLKKSVLSADEVQRIKSLFGDTINLVNGVGNPDSDLEKTIAARIADLNSTFTSAVQADPIYVQIKAQVPLPFNVLAGPHGSQSERDENTRKLAVIAGLVEMQSRDPEILRLLGLKGYQAILMAEQLLLELKEGISLTDLSAEIAANPPRVYVKVDRDTVREKTPIMMKLMFNKSLFNRAAAKRRIVCTWIFNHDNLTEKGWDIFHYFPNAKLYTVAVTFTDENLNQITPGAPFEHKVIVEPQPTEGQGHATVEIQRWAVGFLVAVVGLFAGAEDKILSFSTAGAVLAVFVLGFGIDVAKNLLVPK
jgi:hypothetical protein